LLTGTGSTNWVWVDWSASSLVGWSSTTVKNIYYRQVGKTVHVAFNISGTSNSTTTTIQIPVTPSTHLTYYENALSLAVDNTSTIDTGRISIDNSGGAAAVITLFKNATGGAFTASGTKSVRGQITYEAA
jgi:hypothetical protein